ncbi:MAG: hypothetical protein Kow0027_29130 [Saprospiraceae bacterium]
MRDERASASKLPSGRRTGYTLNPKLYNRRVKQSYFTEFHRDITRSSTELVARGSPPEVSGSGQAVARGLHCLTP